MKKHWSMIGAAALVVGAVLPVNGAPAIAQAFNVGSAIAQNVLQQPKVELNLRAEQQVIQKNAQGELVKTWAANNSTVKVKSGDVLRFTVTGKNQGNKAAEKFAITQPVPRGTVFVLNSAQASTAAAVTYSLDQGKSFTANPVVKVTLPDGRVEQKPAPAEAYTNIRWNVGAALAPMASVDAAYQVAVR